METHLKKLFRGNLSTAPHPVGKVQTHLIYLDLLKKSETLMLQGL